MFSIRIKNIQAIDDYTFEFDKNELIVFKGDNSNGKSILNKALTKLINGEIFDKQQRKDLIRDGCDEGEIIIKTAEIYLQVILRLERKDCRFNFCTSENQEIRERTFQDKEFLEHLVQECGFGVYGKEKLCVQIHQTNGAMPFENTSAETNSELIESITKDAFAVACIENYDSITRLSFDRAFTQIEYEIQKCDGQLKLLPNYDIERYKELVREASEVLKTSSAHYPKLKKVQIQTHKVLHKPELKKIQFRKVSTLFSPTIKRINVSKLTILFKPELRKLPRTLRLLAYPKLINMHDDFAKIISVRNNVCPVCGGYLYDVHTHEV